MGSVRTLPVEAGTHVSAGECSRFVRAVPVHALNPRLRRDVFVGRNVYPNDWAKRTELPAPSLRIENSPDPITKVRNLGRQDVPDQVEIDPEVVVDQAVAHSRHRTPRDVGVRRPHRRRDALRCLADVSRLLTTARCSVSSKASCSRVTPALALCRNSLSTSMWRRSSRGSNDIPRVGQNVRLEERGKRLERNQFHSAIQHTLQ